MDPKSLTYLEFDKVRRRLADFTTFSGGRGLALELAPTTDHDTVAARLARVDQAMDFLDRNGRPPIAGAHDMRAEVESAERGRVLLPAELIHIRDTLDAARRMRRALIRDTSQWPELAALAETLDECPALRDALREALNDEGEVLDSASDALRSIRREKRVAHDRVQRQMERLISDTKVRDYLQEPLVTQRGGRYVVPVKAQFRSKVPGVVHDTSDSGATVFVEPLSVVENGNRYRELLIEEEKEIDRILRELSGYVAAEAPSLADTIDGLSQLDLAFASADYGHALRGVIPQMEDCGTPFLEYPRARHPLLEQETVVPVDVRVGDDFRILVITGPNTGGKTVTLKTVGLLTVMAQAGLAIPAGDGAKLAVFDGVYADIGDEQSIEQSLSTFSGHMTNIVRILETAGPKSLVVLDELGAGTDPVEGAALAVALLDHVRERGVATVASTHYSELKGYAHSTDGVMNASVEFDLATLQPTYELTLGLPGRSNAMAIASRLGLPEPIVTRAREGLTTQDAAMEDLLGEIRTARHAAETNRNEAAAARREADEWASKLSDALEELERQRVEILNEARQKAAEELEATRKTIDSLTREAREAAALGRVSDVESKASAAKTAARSVEELVERPTPPRPAEPAEAEELAPGSTVRIPKFGQDAQVLEVRGDGTAEVAMGQLKVVVNIDEIELVASGADAGGRGRAGGGRGAGRQGGAGGQGGTGSRGGTGGRGGSDGQRGGRGSAGGAAGQGTTRARRSSVSSTAESAPAPAIELDLRGMRVDAGLEALDQRLDRAVLADLPWVQVIHGHGTGAMKEAVRNALSRHPQVKRHRPGERGEGGDGVTVVYLK